MNPQSVGNHRHDNTVTAVGVLVLLLGAATGSAYAMLAMSIAALVLFVVFYRHTPGWVTWLVLTASAATAAVIAYGVSSL